MIVIERQRLLSFNAWLSTPEESSFPTFPGLWEQILTSFVKLRKKQSQTEISLNRTLGQLELGAKALPDAVVFLGEENHIEWCNTRAEEYLQISLKRDRGVQIDYLLRQPIFRKFLSEGQQEGPLKLHLSSSVKEIILSVQVVPYGDKQKLLIAQDITERERQETMRRDFIANVSHELRTPLTVIQGYLETFEDEASPEPELLQRGLELMSDQSRRMNRLVTDLLALSRLETSDEITETVADIPSLIEQLVEETKALSSGRHDLQVEIAPQLKIMCAEDEIRSAFSNIMSNAVRYAPDGGSIKISWDLNGEAPEFKCKDEGVGIAVQHLSRLTERFYRVDKSRSRESGGTGLGLAIVKHVLNRHHAKLSINSTLGQGSEFSIRFPEETIARNN